MFQIATTETSRWDQIRRQAGVANSQTQTQLKRNEQPSEEEWHQSQDDQDSAADAWESNPQGANVRRKSRWDELRAGDRSESSPSKKKTNKYGDPLE